MKKIFYFAAMMALCLSCTKEQQVGSDVIEGDVDSGEVVAATEFSAEFSQEGISKTHLGTLSAGAYPNYWSVGDCINVNGSVSAALGSEYSTNSKTARFLFDNAVNQYDGYWYIGYPAGAFTSFNKGTGTVVVPSSQTYTAGTYDPEAFVMVGMANGKSVKFYPKMGIVRITATDAATPYSYKISKVRLEAIGGESLSGTFTTNYNNDSATFTSTSGNSYIDINAPTSAGLDFGSTFFFAVPIGTYEGGLRFTIYTKDDKSMSFSNSSSIEVGAGTMKNITSPAYVPSEITLSCTFKTSSSAGFEWTASNSSNNVKKVWRLAIYSDSGCNTLVVQHDIPADPDANDVWTDQEGTPRFIVGGLSQGTNYWCKVTDLANGVSKVLAFATDEFTVVQASSPSGTMLLAEDFSEIGWGSAFLGGYPGHRYAGWAPVNAASARNEISFAAPTGVVTDGYYKDWEYAVNNYNTNFDYSTAPRLNNGWGWYWEGGFNGYPQPGFLRMGGKNANRSFVVVPALDITDGMYATVDVTVKIAHMNSGDASDNPDFGVFKETSLTLDNATRREYTGAALNHAYPLTSSVYGFDKDELTFRVNGVKNTDHLVLGMYKNVNQHNRYNLFSVKVQRVGAEYNDEIFDITDDVSLELFRSRVAGGATTLNGNVINDVNASSIASSWTPIAGYTGTLKGNDNTITGLTKPFFNNLGGTVQDLTLNSTISSSDGTQESTAIFAQELVGGTISGCKSRGSVSYTPSTAINNGTRYIAGIVGWAKSGSVTGCTNYASVTVSNNGSDDIQHDAIINAAGVAGTLGQGTTSNASASNLTNEGSVSVSLDATGSNNLDTRVGGVVAYVINRVSSATALNYFINNGTVDYSGKSGGLLSVGGCVGYMNSSTNTPSASNWENTKAVTVTSAARVASKKDINVAGLAAVLYCAMSNSQNSGNITNSGTFSGTESDICIGGIAGNNKGKQISNCHNSGKVNNYGDANAIAIGGLAGWSNGGSSYTSACYNENEVKNGGEGKFIYVGGATGYAKNTSWNSCSNRTPATVSNTADADSLICVGGVAGFTLRDSGTRSFVTCYNSGAVSNTGQGHESPRSYYSAYNSFASEACLGGIAGFVDGVHNLSGTVSAYNYNNGSITEDSASSHVAVGGVVGVSTTAGTSLSYAQNLANGDIAIKDGSNDMTYVGGVLAVGCTYCTLDNTTNKGDIVFTGVTSAQVWCGGVLGQWHEGSERWATATISGCTNEGVIKTNGTDRTDLVSTGTSFSYFGGIVGGGLEDHKNKTYTKCKNTGDISIYCKTKCRIGGIAGTCQTPPNRCEVRANITFRREQGDSGGDLSHIGGIVGFKQGSGSTSYDYLLFLGTIDALAGGYMNNYAGGMVGNTTQNTTHTFTSCSVGGQIKGRSAAPTGSTASAPRLFVGSTSGSSSRKFTFPSCHIEKGTVLKANNEYTMNADSDVVNAYCFHPTCELASGGVLPSVVNSIASEDKISAP